MIHLAQDFINSGEMFDVNNSNPFLLMDQESIWLVERGAIDIFAAEYKNDTFTHKFHLFRITEGQMIFGMPALVDSKLQLLAVGVPDTKVVKVSRDTFNRLATEEKNIKFIVEAVEKWLSHFNELLSKYIYLPSKYDNLKVQTEFLEENKTTLNMSSALWITQLSAPVKWLSRKITEQTIVNGAFPVIAKSWITNRKPLQIKLISTDSCIRKGMLLPSLDVFHRELNTLLSKLLDYLIQAEYKILKRKITDEQHDVELALKQLAATIKTEEFQSYIERTDDLLLDTCQLIAHSLGITLKIRFKKTENKFTLDDIENDELSTRQVKLISQWWKEDNGPLLAFLKENNQPVALIPADFGGYYLIDLKDNAKIFVTEEFARNFQETAFMFIRCFASHKINLKKMITFGLKGTGLDIIRLVIMGVLAGVLGVAIPYATGILFNTIIPGNEFSQLFQVILILMMIAIGIAGLQMANSIGLLRIEGKANVSTQAAIIQRLINLPAPFFRQYSTGDLAQRSFAADNITQLVTSTTQTAILSGVFSLFSWLYMFFVSIKLALLATGLISIALVIFVYLNYLSLKFERQSSRLQGIVLNRVFEFLNAISKLRVAGAELKAFSLWAKSFSKNIFVNVKALKIRNYLLVFNATFQMLSLLFIFGLIGFGYVQIHTGSFLAFYAAFIQFSTAILTMSAALTSTMNAVPYYERVKPILNTLPEADETKRNIDALKGHIEISHLSFRYGADMPLILNDINIKVQPGSFVAIVGPSSSGKSTILRLLLGLEKPESGAIYYDSSNLAELNVQSVRRKMGIVIQNAKLLPGDIFTNIASSSQATLEDAWEAARLAGFEEDIKAMPMGMHTFIMEGSNMISGGQRQRLLIARAIVNKPNILLFDEASSALDNLTQSIVSKSLQELNATRIVIAHRLSTIQQADKIYVLDEGKIVESGSFEELMQQNGKFVELAKRQMVE